MKPKPRTYPSLQAWMEGTRTNSRQLLARVESETGHRISEALFSMILRGSRRCSRFNAFALHVVTGVPMEAMMQWPPDDELHDSASSPAGAKDHRANS